MTMAGPSHSHQGNRVWRELSEGIQREHSLTAEQVKKLKYCGGNYEGRHLNYFRLVFGDAAPLPRHVSECPCGHRIVEQCYVCDPEWNYESIIVVGNCCVEQFPGGSGRTCEVCGGAHRSHKDNLCKHCREKKKPRCDKCGVCFKKREIEEVEERINCSACVKKAKEEMKQKCESCSNFHLNHLERIIPVNRCDTCRILKCDKCSRALPGHYLYGLCRRCGKKHQTERNSIVWARFERMKL